jgi:hypothetical protein
MKKILYLYTATDKKLSAMTYENGILTQQTDYIGNIIYEQDTFQMLLLPEGRYTNKYEYYIKDHLGNVRAIITQESQLVNSGKVIKE